MSTSNEPEPSSKEAEGQTAIYEALARLGIDEVRLRYSGECDSGCIEQPEAFARGEPIPLPDFRVTVTLTNDTYDSTQNRWLVTETTSAPMPLADAIHHWCYDLLENEFPGWEIDHGSSGTIVIDVCQRRGRIDHEYYDVHNDWRSF